MSKVTPDSSPEASAPVWDAYYRDMAKQRRERIAIAALTAIIPVASNGSLRICIDGVPVQSDVMTAWVKAACAAADILIAELDK